eukprot:3957952-Pyramimonas_sp.AAC.1
MKQDYIPNTNTVYGFEDAARIDMMTLAPFRTIVETLTFCTVDVSEELGCKDIVKQTHAEYDVSRFGQG